MSRISTALRISIGLACLTMSLLFIAQCLGLIPDRNQAVLDGRKSLCEAYAVNCCLAAQRDDLAMIRAATLAFVTRNEAVLSTAVRRADGNLVVTAGNHDDWHAPDATHSSNTMVQVPILAGKSRWGTAEIRFRPL